MLLDCFFTHSSDRFFFFSSFCQLLLGRPDRELVGRQSALRRPVVRLVRFALLCVSVAFGMYFCTYSGAMTHRNYLIFSFVFLTRSFYIFRFFSSLYLLLLSTSLPVSLSLSFHLTFVSLSLFRSVSFSLFRLCSPCLLFLLWLFLFSVSVISEYFLFVPLSLQFSHSPLSSPFFILSFSRRVWAAWPPDGRSTSYVSD